MANSPSFEVAPFTELIGSEIKGVDVSKGLEQEIVEQIRGVLHERGVVVLRQQNLEPEQQVAFCQQLGPMRVSFMTDLAVPNTPALTVVSNIIKNNRPIGLVDAGALWHADGSYLPNPDMYSVLYALEIPHKDGLALGDTAFLHAAAAYDAMPSDLREKIDHVEAIHSLSHHIQKKIEANFKAPPVKNDKPDVRHPAVRVHPVTGRRYVYVTEGHTKAIAGLDEDENRVVMQRIAKHVKQPQFIYRHKWRVGDLLIWDNCATQHLAISDYGDLPRRLHRAGISSHH